MDLAARKAQLEQARDQRLAELNAIHGQIALIDELQKEDAAPKATAAQLGLTEPSSVVDLAERRAAAIGIRETNEGGK